MKGKHAGQQELKLRVSPPIQTCLATNQAKSSTSEPVSNFRLNRFLYRGGLTGKFQPNKLLKSRFLASCGVLLYLHSRQEGRRISTVGQRGPIYLHSHGKSTLRRYSQKSAFQSSFSARINQNQMNSQTSCFQIYLQREAMKKLELGKYTRKTNKQTCNLKFDDFLSVPVCVCVLWTFQPSGLFPRIHDFSTLYAQLKRRGYFACLPYGVNLLYQRQEDFRPERASVRFNLFRVIMICLTEKRNFFANVEIVV